MFERNSFTILHLEGSKDCADVNGVLTEEASNGILETPPANLLEESYSLVLDNGFDSCALPNDNRACLTSEQAPAVDSSLIGSVLFAQLDSKMLNHLARKKEEPQCLLLKAKLEEAPD